MICALMVKYSVSNASFQMIILRLVVSVLLASAPPAVRLDDAVKVHKKTDINMVKIDPDKGKYEIYTSMQVSLES